MHEDQGFIIYQRLSSIYQESPDVENKRAVWSMNSDCYEAIKRFGHFTNYSPVWRTVCFMGLPILVTDREIPAIVVLR